MKPVLQSAELFLLAWLVFVALGSLLSAAVARAFGRHVMRWEPVTRHRALLLLAALPILAAAALMLSATLPSLLSLELPGFDHCTLHHDSHPHLCFVHLPSMGVNAGALFVLLVLLGYGVLRASLAAARVGRALRVLRGLGLSGEARRDLGVTIIETSQPLCLTAGLLRPRVLLSRGLLGTLSDEERAIVLAHERAHVRRRDALVATLVRVLATVHVSSVARWLVREIDIAAEQACDEEAGRAVDDRLAVASAILAVERATHHSAMAQLAPVAVAFGQRAAERRVEALLADPVPPRSLLALTLLAGAVALALLSQSGELHHLIESLLSYVAY
jgi:Zn-dependent protease with chaperone function